MKKILLFSDSHGDKSSVHKIMERIDEYDKVIFAGDGERDVTDYINVYPEKVLAVRGNCDIGSNLPLSLLVTVAGVKLFITHGHRYRVKYNLEALISEALCVEADAVLYGHTHLSKITHYHNIILVNGGSLNANMGKASYAELEINKGIIFAKIVKIS